MADFNARIFVDAVTTAAEKAVDKLTAKLEKVNKVAKISMDTAATGRQFTGLRRQVDELGRSLNRIKNIGIAGVLGGNLLAIAKNVNEVGKAFESISGPRQLSGIIDQLNNAGEAAQNATQFLANFADGVGNIVSAAGPANTAMAGLAAVIGTAFAPQIADAAQETFKFGKALGSAVKPLKETTIEFRANFDAIIKAERALGIFAGSVKKISQVQRNLKRTLDSLNSSTTEAAIVADKYVAATRRLNKEQAAQNDLLREAQGLQPQSVRNTEVSRREAAVASGRSRQQRIADNKALQESLQKLEDRERQLNNERLDLKAEQAQLRIEAELQESYERTNSVLQDSLERTRKLREERSRGITRFAGPAGSTAAAPFGPALPPNFLQQLTSAQAAASKLLEIQQKREPPSNRLLRIAGKLKEGYNAQLTVLQANTKELEKALKVEIQRERNLTRARRRKRVEQRREQARQRSQLGQDVLLGAGFPLLFGGGAGSVGGGLLGALAGQGKGGGFGLQIASSAIGQALDQFNQAATELGQALNPLTLDLSAVAKAAGVAGTETEALLKKVEETQGAYVAARLAADQLAVVIGQDGVDALRELGVSATELGNEASKAFAALSAALAPALSAVNNFLANTIQRSRLLSRAQGDFKDDEVIAPILARQGSNVRDLGQLDADDAAALVARAQELEQLEAKAADEKLRGAAAAQQTTNAFAEQLDVLEKRNAVINSTGSLLDEATYIAERQLIFAQTRLDVAKAENDQNKIALALAKERNALDALRARRKQEQDAKDKRDGKGGNRDAERAAQKEAQVQRNLAQLATKSFELDTKSAQLGQTKADQLALQEARTARLFELRRAEIQASTEDQRIKDARLGLLQQEEQIQIRQNQLAKDRLRIEENIAFIKAKQAGDDLQRALDQELAAIAIPTGNRDLDQQNQLRLKQEQRYENAIAGVNNQLKIQRELQNSENDQVSRDATLQIESLERQKEIYQEMLPAISAAEMQQLKFNQAYEKVKPIADAVAGSLLAGIRGVIDGTKTAEEAFKDFLNTIVDLLLKAAVEMIATYIAIGIAKQFAGVGNVGAGAESIGSASGSFDASKYVRREAGGRTMANMPYVVGEKGAELFVPGKTGTIVPADVFEATRQAIAGNAPDGGDSDAFAQNSVALGNTATITKENSLVREMGMRENEPIDVRYESTVINNVSYVSEEQFQKGLKTAVAQSKSAVFSDLKNKPSSRAGIGMR